MSKVRWVILNGFCSKFHTFSSSAKILKVGGRALYVRCAPVYAQKLKYTVSAQIYTSESVLPREQLCYSAVLAVVFFLSVIRSSDTRVLCDKTKQCTADILIPHRRVITLVF